MSRKKQISMFVVIFLVLSTIFLFSVDSSVKGNLSISKLESGKGKTRVEIISSVNTEANHDNNDFFSKNSDNKSWTYMLYLDADNDIEGDAIRDFEWLEQAGGSNDNISFVVLLDRIPGYDNTHGNWNGSRIYNVTDDVSYTTIDSQLMVDLGEVDMADPNTLIDFITYCFDNFPAENYILDLWNHGHAAYGVIDDETSSSHFIVNDIQTAITTVLDASDEEIDILSMDACNMNTIEVAWEMRNLSKYFIASEDSTNGYHYKLIAERLKLNPGINASSFCKLMVDAYKDHYKNTYITCLSAINQTKLLEIPAAINSFVSELITTLDAGFYDNIFKLIRDISYEFYDGHWVDFISLIKNTQFFLDSPSLNQVAEELLDCLNQSVLYNWQHTGYFGRANGITIFMPSGSLSEELIDIYINREGYCAGMDWQTATLWDEFLDYYRDNNLYTSFTEPLLLTLEEVEEDCTIQKNSIKLYRVNIWQNSIYEFYSPIITGDVDIKVIAFDLSGTYETIGGSYLVNPIDATEEYCRFHLKTGFYLVLVYSYNLSSTFDLVVRKCEPNELVCNSPKTSTGGSINGDEQGHYKQVLNHYYQIALPYGNNTITLTNSETANYQLTIYSEFWGILFYLSEAGLGEVLTLQYNQTSDNPIILILEICGYSGVGDFTIEIKNPNEPTPKMGFHFWQFFLFISLILIVYKKKFTKSNQ